MAPYFFKRELSLMDDIWKVIAELGIELHPDRITALSKAIYSVRSVDDVDETTIGSGFENHRSLIAELVDSWRKNKELSPIELAAALRSASRTEAIIREQENIPERFDDFININVHEAWEFLNDTSNGIQIPIDVRKDYEWNDERIDTPVPEIRKVDTPVPEIRKVDTPIDKVVYNTVVVDKPTYRTKEINTCIVNHVCPHCLKNSTTSVIKKKDNK